MNYIHRDIESEFLAYASEFRIVLLTGMRQSGKSTMLAHLAEENRHIVTLDDIQERALAINDPQLFMQIHQPPIIIDEVQYAPELFSYLKIFADQHPDEMGAIWLSGSQPYPLMKLAGESLAGRVGILHMLPLSQHELFGTGTLEPLRIEIGPLQQKLDQQEPALLPQVYERIYRGWMPEVASKESSNPGHYYASYMQTYIERDVRSLDKSADFLDFSRFMSAVAAQTGQLLNINSLARDVDISRAKAKEWIGILQKSDIIFLLHPYSNNALSRAVKTPKLYFNDTGLAAWLGQWDSPKTLERGALSGQIFENYVVSEIAKTIANSGDNASLWFYRDRDAREIDVLIQRNGMLHPVEIKKSANPQRKHIRAFDVLAKSPIETGTGMIVCMAQSIGAIDRSCLIMPAWGL